MFGPPRLPRAQSPQMRWGYHRPPHNPQWRHPVGPRGPFRGHQRFDHPRPQYPSENDNYWCETCDRGFPSEDILNKHKQQHQKCNIDGCQFIAHPKVITKHIQMQHSTGLYKKIANLKNPEDIEKWREERRKRYPTKANIDKKAAILKEKIDRGEKMGLERSRNYRNKPDSEQDEKSGQGVKRKFNTRNDNQFRSKFKRNNPSDNNLQKNPSPKAKPKPTPIITEDKKLKPFEGILDLQMDSDNETEIDNGELNSLIEDDDDNNDCNKLKATEIEKTGALTEPVVCGALSSLMCDYGSSEEDDSIEIVKIPKSTLQSSENITKSECNQIHIAATAKCDSGATMCEGEANNDIIDLKETVLNQPKHTEGNVIIRQEAKAKQNSMDFVHKLDDQDNESSSLENKMVSKKVSITSTPTSADKGETHNDNNENRETKVSKPSCALEDTDNIKYGDTIKEDTVQEKKHNEGDSDSGPEEIKIDLRKEDTLEVLDESKIRNVRKNKIVKGRPQINLRRRPKLPSTLLQKLLFKEMQQERNKVLQCIRYIKRNNYFDKKE